MCNDTNDAVPKKIRPAVPSKTRAPAFLPVDTTPELVPEDIAAPALPACARTQPESLSG